MTLAKAQKFYEKEKYKQAEQLCLNALEANPMDMEAARLQSLVMLRTGRIQDGLEFLKIALAQNPNDPQNNLAMGIYSMKLNNLPAAESALMRAYQADPKNTDILMYLGDVYATQEEWTKAIVFYAKFIEIDPTHVVMNQMYANKILHCDFEKYSDLQVNALTTVLLDERVAVKRIYNHWVNIVFRKGFYPALARAFSEKDYDLDKLKDELNAPFFTKGVERLKHSLPATELFLTDVRKELLHNVHSDENAPLSDHINFLTALSIQCWLNEYVFYVTEEEKEWLQGLKQTIEANAHDNDQMIAMICLYGSYGSPLEIEGIEDIAKKLSKGAHSDFLKFCKIHILDALEEQKIKKTIPQFTTIDDEISKMVQEQYEESPYPRNLDPVMIDGKIIDPAPYNMLFAGCGTGYQIIGFAKQHPNATMTAVDLSLSSLSYAIRETRQQLKLPQKKLKIGQADILKLEEMPDRYDRIFCTGVLHHMEDPEKGLAVLKKILKPDGQMRLAYYSETARQNIVKTRDYIEDHNYQPTLDDIRRFRRDIVNLCLEKKNEKFMEFLFQIPDFYSLSECRDLIFHVQEHRYTIPQIIEMLDRHDLEFIGFNLRRKHLEKAFLKRFPEDGAIRDPMKWHEYEQENPYVFVEMYDFDVRHKGAV